MNKTILSITILACAVVSRFLPHPPNVTPLTAVALTGSIFLDKRLAFIVPLAAMFLSDLIIGFHGTILYVYASFAIISLLGIWLRNKRTFLPVAGASITSSIVFFVVTNFGVWANGDGTFYPRTLDGLIACYAAGIPFFRNAVLGDIFYTTALFGLYRVVENLGSDSLLYSKTFRK